MIRLTELLAELPDTHVRGDADCPVRDVVYDSRRIRSGDVFVAIPGRRQDGGRFATEALARGAVAVVAERPDIDLPPDATLVVVPNARRALGLLAAARHGHPSRHLGLVGITGTDGKTTTSTLTAEILEAAGVGAGLSSTVYQQIGGRRRPNRAHHTTPESPELQAHLARLVRGPSSTESSTVPEPPAGPKGAISWSWPTAVARSARRSSWPGRATWS